MKLVFLGPPGAGKGTQAERLCDKYDLAHISTGDMLRHQIEQQTDIGRLADELINRGELVPDAIVIKMVLERIKEKDARNGIVLDGFPRTVEQAQLMNDLILPDLVINIDVPLERLLARIVNRRSCSDCDMVYNRNDLESEYCPRCGKKLAVRKDDTPKVIEERFHVYTQRTMPIINYYEAQELIAHIDGDRSIELVERDITEAVGRILK